MWRRSLSAAVIAAALTTAASSVEAQVVVVGNAQACFYVGCTASENASTTVNGVPLSYSSGVPIDFSGTTVGGQLTLNSAANNFGSLFLGTSWKPRAIVVPLSLTISFINPLASSTVFDALLLGFVAFDDFGGAVVGFHPPTSPNLSFFDPISGTSGTMTVTAFPTVLTPGNSTNIGGLIHITSSTSVVPEPASLLLLATGLLGLGGAAARRRRTMTPA